MARKKQAEGSPMQEKESSEVAPAAAPTPSEAPSSVASASSSRKKRRHVAMKWVAGVLGTLVLTAGAKNGYDWVSVNTWNRPVLTAELIVGVPAPDGNMDQVLLTIENRGQVRLQNLLISTPIHGAALGSHSYHVRDSLGEPVSIAYDEERRLLSVRKPDFLPDEKVVVVIYLKRGALLPRESITIRTKEIPPMRGNDINLVYLN